MRKEKTAVHHKTNIPDIEIIDLDNYISEDDQDNKNEYPSEELENQGFEEAVSHNLGSFLSKKIAWNGNLQNQDLLWMILAALTSLVIVFFVYKLWRRDITCPIVYYGDGVGGLLSIKNIRDGNGFFYFPSLRAPYGEYNYNQDYILPLIIISFFSIFTKSVGALSNIFWLSTYIFTAFTAYAFLRRVHCQHIIAFTGAIIYNFLPYHYFRIEHFWLFGCYIIPLIGWIIVDILEGSVFEKSSKIRVGKIYINKVLIIDIVFSILIGLNGLYYSYFAVLLFAFSGVISAIELKRVKSFWFFILYSSVVFSIVVFYMIFYGWIHDGGQALANISSTRGIADVHTYSLDMFLLLLPIPGHRIEIFSQFTQKCYELFNIHTENYQAALGLIMSAGFLVSIVFAFLSKRKGGEFILIRQMGILNIFTIMVACIGGFGTFVSLFVSSAIRCYNRTSVIIALFAVASICLILNYLFKRYKIRPAYRLLICSIVCIIGIYDQTSPCFADYSTYNAIDLSYSGNRDELEQRYKEDMEFIKNIELQLGENKNIYVLPNEVQYSPDRVSFAKTKGYICGKTLNWSATILDSQYSNAMTLIESNDFNTFIKCISFLGFSGVVIDKNGFINDEYFNAYIEYFKMELSLVPYFNITSDLCFFDISSVAQAICNNYSEEYIEHVRNYLCNDVTTNILIPIDLTRFYIDAASIDTSDVKLSKGEIFHGPYIDLDPGYYQVIISGEQLDECEINLTANQGNKALDLLYTETMTDTIIYEFYLENTTEDIEFALSNINSSITINGIVLQIANDDSFISYDKYMENIELKRAFLNTFKVPLSNFYIGGTPQEGDSFIIPQNTMQYGPYLEIDPGNYRVTIGGKNLLDAEIQLVTNGGRESIEISNVTESNDQISFEFTTYKTTVNLEVYLSNANHDMQIREYIFEILN